MEKKYPLIFDMREVITIHSVSTDGNIFTVLIHDSDTEPIFGDNDSHSKAINVIIDSMDFDFEIQDDSFCFEKRMISIIDSVGKRINTHSYDEHTRNVDAVKEFVDHFIENNFYDHPAFKDIVDRQDEFDDEEGGDIR